MIIDIMKSQGRTQQWLLTKLKERGHTIDAPRLSRYVNGVMITRDMKFYIDTADLLGVTVEDVISESISENNSIDYQNQEEK